MKVIHADLCLLEREELGRDEWTIRVHVFGSSRMLLCDGELKVVHESKLGHVLSIDGWRSLFDNQSEKIAELLGTHGLTRYVAVPVHIMYEIDERIGDVTILSIRKINPRDIYIEGGY